MQEGATKMAPKARFHKGVVAHFRKRLRALGVSVDHETSLFMLAGMPVAMDPWMEPISRLRQEAFDNRSEASRQWEGEHPGANPFPPPFPERVIEKLRDVGQVLSGDDPDPFHAALLIEQIVTMARAEMALDEEWLPPITDKKK